MGILMNLLNEDLFMFKLLSDEIFLFFKINILI
jgi:hypothetical protein